MDGGLEGPMISRSQPFDQLWFSKVVSGTKSSFVDESKNYSSCWEKDKWTSIKRYP